MACDPCCVSSRNAILVVIRCVIAAGISSDVTRCDATNSHTFTARPRAMTDSARRSASSFACCGTGDLSPNSICASSTTTSSGPKSGSLDSSSSIFVAR